MCICYLRIRDNDYGKNADQYLATKCFLIEWLTDVLDGQHLSDCGKPNHSLGPLWINVLDIALLFREITCGSNLWRVLCSCISVFLTNIFLSVTGKWPLVYAYMKQLTLKHLGFSGVIQRLEATIHRERQTTQTNTNSVHQLKQEVRDMNRNINKITNVMDRMEGTLNRVVSKLNSFDTKIGISLAGAATSLDAFGGPLQCCNHKSITDSCCTTLHFSQEGAVGYRGSIKHKWPSIWRRLWEWHGLEQAAGSV